MRTLGVTVALGGGGQKQVRRAEDFPTGGETSLVQATHQVPVTPVNLTRCLLTSGPRSLRNLQSVDRNELRCPLLTARWEASELWCLEPSQERLHPTHNASNALDDKRGN